MNPQPDSLRVLWGVNIRVAREAKEHTQAELGKRVGVNQSTVAKWEKGTISPTRDNMVLLARVLEAEAREMFPLDATVAAVAVAAVAE